MFRVISNVTQTLATTAQAATGAAISMTRAQTFGVQVLATVNTPGAKTAIDGTPQSQIIDFVADVSGSLNSKYFTFNSINTTTGASKGFYIWFNINSAGVDPAIAGRTAVPITGATNVAAATLVTSCKTALELLTGDFTTCTASTSHLTINNLNPGAVTAAADGTAATGFTFNTPSVPGVNSKVNPVLDTFSITAHGFPTGLKIRATSTGTLPAGITTGVDYFVIVVDDNTIQFATSLANALVPTAIDITGYGTTPATSTFTPTSIAGGVVKLEASNDGTNWGDAVAGTGDTVTANITATGSVFLQKVLPYSAYMRLNYAITAGSYSASAITLISGEIP